jgi:hypothetical protein
MIWPSRSIAFRRRDSTPAHRWRLSAISTGAQVQRAFGAAEDAENFLRLGMVWVDWFKSFLIFTVLASIWHGDDGVVYLETPDLTNAPAVGHPKNFSGGI